MKRTITHGLIRKIYYLALIESFNNVIAKAIVGLYFLPNEILGHFFFCLRKWASYYIFFNMLNFIIQF